MNYTGLWLFYFSCLDGYRRWWGMHAWLGYHSAEGFSLSVSLDLSAFAAHLVFRFSLEV